MRRLGTVSCLAVLVEAVGGCLAAAHVLRVPAICLCVRNIVESRMVVVARRTTDKGLHSATEHNAVQPARYRKHKYEHCTTSPALVKLQKEREKWIPQARQMLPTMGDLPMLVQSVCAGSAHLDC